MLFVDATYHLASWEGSVMMVPVPCVGRSLVLLLEFWLKKIVHSTHTATATPSTSLLVMPLGAQSWWGIPWRLPMKLPNWSNTHHAVSRFSLIKHFNPWPPRSWSALSLSNLLDSTSKLSGIDHIQLCCTTGQMGGSNWHMTLKPKHKFM